jgi:Predicted metal binding domain
LARIDPEVCRRKYARELTKLHDQRDDLQARGIFVVGEPTYPSIDLLFVPRIPLKVAVATMASGPIVLPPGAVAMTVAELPSLAAKAFRARFDLTDYDLRAPSLMFLDHWTGRPLEYNTMFRALEFEKYRQAHLVLLDDHPTFHRPFLCLRGIREYHEHPQHSGDEWLLYRTEMSLFSAVMSLWRAAIDIVAPILIPQPNGLQVNWNAEAKE